MTFERADLCIGAQKTAEQSFRHDEGSPEDGEQGPAS